MMYQTTFLTIEAGHWLQAGATVFAVVGTILGTLYIERRSKNAETDEANRRILEVVTHIKSSASEIRAGLPDDSTNFAHYAQSLTMQTSLKTAIDMYRFVRADTRIKDLGLWRTLRSLDDTLTNHGKIVETELRLLSTNGHYTAVFDINRSKVMAAAVPIDVAAQDVLLAAP